MSTSVCFTTGSPPRLTLAQQPHATGTKCELEYLDEGGANFVFKILPSTDSPLPEDLRGKLVRLRKGKAHLEDTAKQMTAFDANFRPLFPPKYLIEQTLIQLDKGVTHALNSSLQTTNRPSRRQKDIVADDPHAMLVTDMTPGPEELLVQFKPKWLVQSPTAPDNAKRCRTCALRAQRLSERNSTATDDQATCPLELVDEATSVRQRAFMLLPANVIGVVLGHVVEPILQSLRRYQEELDPKLSEMKTDEAELNLCKAMTLRDCTVYVKESDDKFEARLGDLDLKQPIKRDRWRQIEEDLINGGWYTNTEANDIWTQEIICTLSRTYG